MKITERAWAIAYEVEKGGRWIIFVNTVRETRSSSIRVYEGGIKGHYRRNRKRGIVKAVRVTIISDAI